ncbi:MAG TPA: peptidylprolyl isomerase [Bryobacteraceae bacterium]|jgi:parvulin-like peptidyl-prolyl isomerase|nr:peptidylprolyl isomerase [Bryobacteraceae bacterium]
MSGRLIILLAASISGAAAADVHIVEEIVAKVNNDVITRGELARTRSEIEAELHQQGLSGAKLQQAVQEKASDSLRDQIDQLLLVEKAKDLNINVDTEISKRLAAMQVQSKIVDEDKFHDFIREQMNMSFEDFKQQAKNQLLTQRVISEEIGSRIAIPEADKRKYYDAHKADFVRDEEVFTRKIFISTEGKTPDQVAAAEQKAKDLVARARKGEKFGDLAATNSDDLETARAGGDMPPFKRGQFLKQIDDIVFAQKKGYVTDPIRVGDGFVIFRIEDRYEKGQATYEEVENEINERLVMPQMNAKVRTYLTTLRKEAFLEIKPGFVDSGAAPGKDTTWKDVAQLRPQTVTKEQVAAHHRRKRLLFAIPVPGTGDKKPPASKTAATPVSASAGAPPTPDAVAPPSPAPAAAPAAPKPAAPTNP